MFHRDVEKSFLGRFGRSLFFSCVHKKLDITRICTWRIPKIRDVCMSHLWDMDHLAPYIWMSDVSSLRLSTVLEDITHCFHFVYYHDAQSRWSGGKTSVFACILHEGGQSRRAAASLMLPESDAQNRHTREKKSQGMEVCVATTNEANATLLLSPATQTPTIKLSAMANESGKDSFKESEEMPVLNFLRDAALPEGKQNTPRHIWMLVAIPLFAKKAAKGTNMLPICLTSVAVFQTWLMFFFF